MIEPLHPRDESHEFNKSNASDESNSSQARLMAALIASLERKPEVRIPGDFAARVALRVQALPVPAARHTLRYGPLATGVGLATMLLAMFALAPWAQPSFTSLGFDLELLLLAQMLALTSWQMLRNRA